MASFQAAPATVRFSTRELPERDRVAAFREHFGRKVIGLDFQPEAGAAFHAETALRALPGLQIVSAVMSAARHARTPELLADGNDDFCLVTVKCPMSEVSQRGRESMLRAGDAILICASDVSALASPSTMPFLGLRIPFAALAPLIAGSGSAIALPIPRSSESLRLLIDYLALLDHATTPELQRAMVAHVYDLVALTIGATKEAADIAAGRGLRAARLGAIKAYVLQNLDRDLSVTTVAGEQGVTPRYVQMLFESEGTTFSAFVRGQRLDRVRRMLGDPRCAHLSITEIAFQRGFNDLSTFNRWFHRQYGMTPREARHVRMS